MDAKVILSNLLIGNDNYGYLTTFGFFDEEELNDLLVSFFGKFTFIKGDLTSMMMNDFLYYKESKLFTYDVDLLLEDNTHIFLLKVD